MISGTTIIHNAIERDYCIRECIASIVPLCDEIICMECSSTDGTADLLREIAVANPKLRVYSAPWTPGPGGLWLSELVNEARSRITGDYHFHIQADEVLGPRAIPEIKAIAAKKIQLRAHRLNFWIDPFHILPHDKVCSHLPLRGSVPSTPSIFDAESLMPEGDSRSVQNAIFHYGFIRNPQAFSIKSIATQVPWMGSCDPVAAAVGEKGIQSLEDHCPLSRCSVYHGDHPEVARDWLRSKGHTV